MNSQAIIRVERVSKQYRFGQIGHGTLYRDLSSWWARVRGKEDPNARIVEHRLGVTKSREIVGDRFLALNDVSFEVGRGEALGVIGRNGAGKSTLLKILSRVTAPTSGTVKVKGHISSLLEVGTGFHPELSGRENVFLNGAILGMSRAEVRAKFDEIVEFAEIGDFIDTPVKRYSSGMYVRLAFAVAAHLEPEVLLLDEVLAVGDVKFVRKCMAKMESVRHDGRTIIFVSHGMSSVLALCQNCMLLEGGKVVKHGPSKEVVEHYYGFGLAEDVLNDYVAASDSSKLVQIRNVAIRHADGSSSGVFSYDECVRVDITYQVHKATDRCSVWLAMRSLDEVILFGSSDSDANGALLGDRAPGIYKTSVTIPARLANVGKYYFAIGVVRFDPVESLDRIDIGAFRIEHPTVEGPDEFRERTGIFKPTLPWETLRLE
jgi:lipopolysaccharide transport system ATP-binding protein